MTAYERRYHRQLRDIGVATALAQHDPQALDRLTAPTRHPNGDRAGGEKWW